MKVEIGMRVRGEVDSGKVIAMTNEWCIYQIEKPYRDGTREIAENWRSIEIVADGPAALVSSLSEKEI
jgi:hypothetical protein